MALGRGSDWQGDRTKRAASCLNRVSAFETHRWKSFGGPQSPESEYIEQETCASLKRIGTRSPPLDSFRSAVVMTPGAQGAPCSVVATVRGAGEAVTARSVYRLARLHT
jgi:hypothetical protein